MSKRALGSQWNRLAPDERQEFVDLFRQLLAHTDLDRLEGRGKERVDYFSERLEEGYAEVRTRVVSTAGSVPVDFRLVQQAGQWRVYDPVVDQPGERLS